jgi:hypothetical protein
MAGTVRVRFDPVRYPARQTVPRISTRTIQRMTIWLNLAGVLFGMCVLALAIWRGRRNDENTGVTWRSARRALVAVGFVIIGLGVVSFVVASSG